MMVIAALLHDVGMLVVPREIVSRPAPLSRDQMAEVARHTLHAEAILAKAGRFDEAIVRTVTSHHERMDGTGYPRQLKAAQLDSGSRLLAVADAYVARRSPRPHRPAAGPSQALRETLVDSEAGRLDAEWCCRLLNLSLYPVGTVVELSSGEVAEVIAPQETTKNLSLAGLPIVRVLKDRLGHPVAIPRYWNLAHRPDCRIVRQLSSRDAAKLFDPLPIAA